MSLIAKAIGAVVDAGEGLTQWRDLLRAKITFTRFSHLLAHDPTSYDRMERWKVRLGLLLISIFPVRDLSLLLSLGMLAEGQGMERAFVRFMRHAFRIASSFETSASSSSKRLSALLAFRLATLDIAGARTLAERHAAPAPGASESLDNIQAMENECAAWSADIEAAQQSLACRLSRAPRQMACEGLLVYVPAAAFRSNLRDYPGFRSDIRNVFERLFRILQEEGVPYSVRYRLAKHGRMDHEELPFVAYHTVGSGSVGLHIKETDRPHHFSADPTGYSGWSRFSLSSGYLADRPDDREVRSFVEADRRAQIGSNSSKYQQPNPSIENIPEGCIFVALQVIDDAVQRLSHLHMFEMLEEVSTAAAARGIPVVVKRHPLCRSRAVSWVLKRGVARGRFTVSTASIHALIARSRAVCVVNSGVGAEALLHGKPVYAFGTSDYQSAARVITARGEFARRFGEEMSEEEVGRVRNLLMRLRTDYSTDLRDPAAEVWWREKLRPFLAATAYS